MGRVGHRLLSFAGRPARWRAVGGLGFTIHPRFLDVKQGLMRHLADHNAARTALAKMGPVEWPRFRARQGVIPGDAREGVGKGIHVSRALSWIPFPRLAGAPGMTSGESSRVQRRPGAPFLDSRAPSLKNTGWIPTGPKRTAPVTARPKLDVLLCAPRGFCAGVVRAIDAVEQALARYGAPVYVRHEIVHNKYVVDGLRRKGAVFVKELDQVEDKSRPVIFSAHGVPKSVPADADARQLFAIDATCPLVTKVHREAEIHHKRGRHVILVGHAGHPEVVGTMGQLPPGAITLVETLADVAGLQPEADSLAFVTQTTLSVDDTREIVEALQARFPAIVGPHKEDICYATTNRQEAVKHVAPQVDAMIVVGSPNSSNSQRLREVAERAGCKAAALVLRAEDIDWGMFGAIRSLGVTAGASAPEVLVEEIIDAFAARYDVEVRQVSTADESVFFPLPRELRPAAE
jgi:4-hydroxy-3-methylbut-2-enyl diphosphate reductase